VRYFRCYICKSQNSSSIYKSNAPISITSDLRLWHSPVEVFQCDDCGFIFKDYVVVKKELNKLYKTYQLFEEKEEEDQAIFLPNSPPKPRSRVIAEALSQIARPEKEGEFLDIGCNKGILLREFGKMFPKWLLYGYEISKEYEKYVKKIPRLKKFYWGSLRKINNKFDLISLVHTLEHVPNPLTFLKQVKKLLNPNGLLLIQVPNYSQNAFDVLLFEHMSHFTPETLEQILINAGYEVSTKSLSITPKELTFIAKISPRGYKGTMNFSAFLKKQTKANVKFLNNYEKSTDKAKNKKPLAIFGTAEVGTWTSGLLKDDFDMFLDESPWRIGKKHLGHKINHPRIIKSNYNVILAMAPLLAKKVYTKYKHTRANFIYPTNL